MILQSLNQPEDIFHFQIINFTKAFVVYSISNAEVCILLENAIIPWMTNEANSINDLQSGHRFWTSHQFLTNTVTRLIFR